MPSGWTPQNTGNKSTQRDGFHVSKQLRSAGFNIRPAEQRHKVEGVFVSNGIKDRNTIRAIVSFDYNAHTERTRTLFKEISETLRSLNYEVVERIADDYMSLNVSKPR